jgi:2-polyprenyl-3-methyl-5-hydroxy-6-metoxy-1,4-benzoquinol methylase
MAAYEPSTTEVRITVLMGVLAAPIYRNYVNRLGLEGNERVLDFGCGSANPGRYIAARLAQGGGHLTCVDVSQRWLEVARKRLSRYANAEFRLGDIRELAIPARTYDVVFIHFVLHEIPAAERASITGCLAEKLKPGGKLFLREPLQMISAGDIQAAMQAAGLALVSATTGKIFSQGEVFEGVYSRVVETGEGS